MAKEIEYKFLINEEHRDVLLQELKNIVPLTIKQSYLITDNFHTVKIEIGSETESFIVISSKNILSYQYTIPTQEAKDIIALFKAYPDGLLVTNLTNICRIRTQDNIAFLTFKGKAEGIERPEFEYSIPLKDAAALQEICSSYLTKDRYILPAENNLKWEIDFFKEKNAPLEMVEIELPTKTTSFNKPVWIGKDVSEDYHYTNSYLSVNSFSSLKKNSL